MTYLFGHINMSQSSKNSRVLICILQGLNYLKGANLRVTSHDSVFLLNDKTQAGLTIWSGISEGIIRRQQSALQRNWNWKISFVALASTETHVWILLGFFLKCVNRKHSHFIFVNLGFFVSWLLRFAYQSSSFAFGKYKTRILSTQSPELEE